jgi:pyruvate/2-oxoglutarate dehydrogenase complex dihydrolipoamide dehydrogenase (E3) component
MESTTYAQQLQPFDEFNQALAENVHPSSWTNPKPAGRYNLVVIGAGTAGLVTAAGAAGLGARVALIERGLMGGDCLNVGCVPSKAIIAAARRAAAVRDASHFHTYVDRYQSDFAAVMQRMRALRASISPHDSANRFASLGVDVFFGQGVFQGPDQIQVAGQTLSFRKAVIATGARAAESPIPGLRETGYLTNESLFSLTELPKRLLVIGGGPIGCEMAQSFARLGSHVTQIESGPHILSREESDAAIIVQNAIQRDGVNIMLHCKVIRATRDGADRVLVVQRNGQSHELRGDAILLGIGRTPNVDGLGLEQAGVEYHAVQGVKVNDRLQTTNPRIFAAGDVCSKFKFTHAADFLARTVIQNALFMGRARASQLTVPWCTYTSPELAHVGVTPESAAGSGIELTSFTQALSGVDRSILDGETEGFVRVHCLKGSDRILGATLVGTHAGDWIGEIVMAMKYKIGLGKIASVIHPYPTTAEAIRKLGDQYNRTRLTPFVKRAMKTWLGWTG